MSCGNLPSGTFSPLRDTWSKKSDLHIGKWNPYPELQNPANCYGTNSIENYYNDMNNETYRLEQVSVPGSHTPGITNSIRIENYEQGLNCCWTSPYTYLNKTWTAQKPFTL